MSTSRHCDRQMRVVLGGIARPKHRGVTVAEDLAPDLKTRICVQTSDLASSRTPNDLSVVITHLRAAYHLRNLLLSRDVANWIYNQVLTVRSGGTELRTPREYDTLLRVSTILEKSEAYHNLAKFFGCPAGQEACESPSSILPSTARSIAQLYINARDQRGYTYFRSNVLVMLNARRSHLVASPTLTANLLRCPFAEEEGSVEYGGPLRVKPPHYCGRASCEAMTYLIAILAWHDFGDEVWLMMDNVQGSLKARTFETFALFCREFPPSKACTHLKSSLTFWMSGDNPFSQISLCSRDIMSFLPFCDSLSRTTCVHTIRHLLHRDQSWCAPDSSDLGREEALDACLEYLTCIVSDLSEVKILLDDACLKPLQRAPSWNDSPLLIRCVEALASAGNDGSDVGDLVSKFIFCEAQGGPDGTSTRTWDLVVAGSQTILAHAQSGRSGHRWILRQLCEALGILRRRYPYKARWREMGDRVRNGAASFLNDATWRASTGKDKSVGTQNTLEKFWEVMSADDESFSGLEMNTALLWATDDSELQCVGAPSQSFIEWQVDGAY